MKTKKDGLRSLFSSFLFMTSLKESGLSAPFLTAVAFRKAVSAVEQNEKLFFFSRILVCFCTLLYSVTLTFLSQPGSV